MIVGGLMTNWAEMAKPAHRLVAFDKRTGEIVWFNGTRIGPYDTNYSAPTVTVDRRPEIVGLRLGRR